jgi:hypothetical protein
MFNFLTRHHPLASATIPPKKEGPGVSSGPGGLEMEITSFLQPSGPKSNTSCDGRAAFASQAAAIAREPAGFIWAIARRVLPTAG